MARDKGPVDQDQIEAVQETIQERKHRILEAIESVLGEDISHEDEPELEVPDKLPVEEFDSLVVEREDTSESEDNPLDFDFNSSSSSKFSTSTSGPSSSGGGGTSTKTGRVDFFNDTGGYGFIETEDADEDVFFHMEDIGGPDLEEGIEVEFEIEDAESGPRAKNIDRL